MNGLTYSKLIRIMLQFQQLLPFIVNLMSPKQYQNQIEYFAKKCHSFYCMLQLYFMETALIVVDVQNDFCEGGPLGVQGSKEIFPFINSLKRLNFEMVVVTQDWHPDSHMSFAKNHQKEPFTEIQINGQKQMLWPQHCIKQTHGAQLSPLYKKGQNDITVLKGFRENEEVYSAFGTKQNRTQLETILKQRRIKKVIVVGLALDYCVGLTALDAAQAGFETIVPKEGTKGIAPNTIQDMIQKFKKHGIKYQSMQKVLL